MAPRTVGFSESASGAYCNHPSGISNQPNSLPKLEDLITTSFYFIKTWRPARLLSRLSGSPRMLMLRASQCHSPTTETVDSR